MNQTLLISAIIGIVLFIMFWRLCSNIGSIRKGIDIISEYTLIQAKKEGIKRPGNDKDEKLADNLRQ